VLCTQYCVQAPPFHRPRRDLRLLCTAANCVHIMGEWQGWSTVDCQNGGPAAPVTNLQRLHRGQATIEGPFFWWSNSLSVQCLHRQFSKRRGLLAGREGARVLTAAASQSRGPRTTSPRARLETTNLGRSPGFHQGSQAGRCLICISHRISQPLSSKDVSLLANSPLDAPRLHGGRRHGIVTWQRDTAS